ncbi:securin [Pleurodeles waltl]
MATLIYVDQENGGISANGASKDRTRLPSASAKGFSERSLQSQRPGKVFNSAPVVRKGLGNAKVNVCKTAEDTQAKHMKKPKVQQPSVKNPATRSKAEYPDIEKFIPYNPLDFECFDVPEEHQLSHLSLAGVSLQTLDIERFDRNVNLVPSPLKSSPFTWESDILHSSFLCSLEEVTVDLPPLWED